MQKIGQIEKLTSIGLDISWFSPTDEDDLAIISMEVFSPICFSSFRLSSAVGSNKSISGPCNRKQDTKLAMV